MITKEIIKSEIDRVQNEYLEPLFKIIKAFEKPDILSNQYLTKNINDDNSDWKDFINSTYGCLSDAPIERGGQGNYEIRENIE